MNQLDLEFPIIAAPQQAAHGDRIPCRGLLIRDPYISDILDGKKRWELRGFATRIRGPIGLIKSTSGHVFGECVLRECIGPLELDALLHSSEIGPHDLSELQRTGVLPYTNPDGCSATYAWVFDDVRAYPEPISYRHPAGAVTFVNLARAVAR
jgi:hypothetical protein